MYADWRYDEFRQVGKDYGKSEEASHYDASHADFRDVREENRATLEWFGLSEGSTVVDIGTGTGEFALAAAKAGHRVLAVDVSEAMLAIARKKADAAGVGSLIEFHHCGFLSFDPGAREADAVASSLCLHHLPDFWKAVAIERIHGMLKPGGRFFLRDVVLPDERAVEAVNRFIESQASVGGAFLHEDAETHFREEFSTYAWIMKGLLERSGFRILETSTEGEILRSYLCERPGPPPFDHSFSHVV